MKISRWVWKIVKLRHWRRNPCTIGFCNIRDTVKFHCQMTPHPFLKSWNNAVIIIIQESTLKCLLKLKLPFPFMINLFIFHKHVAVFLQKCKNLRKIFWYFDIILWSFIRKDLARYGNSTMVGYLKSLTIFYLFSSLYS